MSHHLIPDSALDWWARGFTAPQIKRILREKTGKRFTEDGIRAAIRWASRQGDMRAARRNEPTQTGREYR